MDTPVNLPPATDPVGLISALLTDLQQLVGVLPGCEMPASAQAAQNYLRGNGRPESGHLEAIDPAALERARAMVGRWRVWDDADHVFTSLPEALIAEVDRLTGELMGYRRSFQLRWAADKRAIQRWRKEAPERELVWPDHADLVVWLLGQLRELAAERATTLELALVIELEALAALRKLVEELDALIADSAGVLGLHQNGDTAPWDSLMADGRYPWLASLDEARDVCARSAAPATTPPAAKTAVPSPLPPALVVRYRNYRGEMAVRHVVPTGAPFHGSTKHHPKAGWILPVYDVEREVEREFAMDDMAALAALEPVRQAVADYHYALDMRQHGGLAAGRALTVIQQAMGMPWVQGEEKARREAAAGEGVDHA